MFISLQNNEVDLKWFIAKLSSLYEIKWKHGKNDNIVREVASMRDFNEDQGLVNVTIEHIRGLKYLEDNADNNWKLSLIYYSLLRADWKEKILYLLS